MGVPSFFKWLSVKYSKIVVDCIEDRVHWTDDGREVAVNTSKANPNGIEFDNLYLVRACITLATTRMELAHCVRMLVASRI